jgi:MFS family permease
LRRRPGDRALTVLVVTLAQFMAVMSTSVVSVALPTIGRDLHASSTSLEWIVDAYVIVFASLLIAGGVLRWDLAAVGLGGGLSLTPMTATAMAAVRSERAGMASAIHNSMRQVGQALGVAVLGSLVYAGVRGGGAAGGRLQGASAAAFVDGLHRAVVVSGACLLVAAALAVALIPAGLLVNRGAGPA